MADKRPGSGLPVEAAGPVSPSTVLGKAVVSEGEATGLGAEPARAATVGLGASAALVFAELLQPARQAIANPPQHATPPFRNS